jgi:hypothetical protein
LNDALFNFYNLPFYLCLFATGSGETKVDGKTLKINLIKLKLTKLKTSLKEPMNAVHLFIKSRLEALVGTYLKGQCEKNGLTYPPKFVLFRFFKYEEEFEVWAGNTQSDSLKRILLLKVCAVDNVPGTKLEEGDGKTPEGFYNSPLYYGSTADFMWIKLNNSEIGTYGKVGYGSSFKNVPRLSQFVRSAKNQNGDEA